MIHKDTFKKVNFNGAKGLVFLGNKIITYRRDNKTNSSPLLIDLPGGGREGEESPFDCFKREVKEEFGINVEKEDIEFSIAYQSRTNPNKQSYFFITKKLKFSANNIIFGDEGTEWFLMSPEEFVNRPDGIKKQQEDVARYMIQLGIIKEN